MSAPDEMPTLAGLRRKRSSRGKGSVLASSTEVVPPMFSLFEQAEPVSASAAVEVSGALPSAPVVPRDSWTVSELVGDLRRRVERGYGTVAVEGEISNWRPAGSGHCYFTLKDDGAQIAAVMFRARAALLRFRPQDGDAVRLRGQLSVYEGRGQVQLIVDSMSQVGLGAQLAAVQRLKERLAREGMFDRRRLLPGFPRCIGVVTSLSGAALRDIVKVCMRRHAAVRLLVYPVAVQGAQCAAEVVRGLQWFAAHPERADVVLVARGGGSWEDLHGFDDEAVVRAIAASPLPVITGIGHAPDSTLADAAADVCAPTPSAAAELLTAAQFEIEEKLERMSTRLRRAGQFRLMEAQGRLARSGVQTALARVEDRLNRQAQRVDELGFRAEGAWRRRWRGLEDRLRAVEVGLRRANPELRLAEGRARLGRLEWRLQIAGRGIVEQRRQRGERIAGRLHALSPLRVLDRGYALVFFERDGERRLVRSAAEVEAGAVLETRLREGAVRSVVVVDV